MTKELVFEFFDKHYSHASDNYRSELKKAFSEFIKDKEKRGMAMTAEEFYCNFMNIDLADFTETDRYFVCMKDYANYRMDEWNGALANFLKTMNIS